MAGLNHPILPGASFDLYLHGEEIQCHVHLLVTVSVPGKVEVKRPKCVCGGSSAIVKIKVERAVCIEPFSDCMALGRFALRAKGSTCAVGVCLKIY